MADRVAGTVHPPQRRRARDCLCGEIEGERGICRFREIDVGLARGGMQEGVVRESAAELLDVASIDRPRLDAMMYRDQNTHFTLET
jgi:hypothetical protein